MSNIEDNAQEFDDLNMPAEQYDETPVEGMPDPTAKLASLDDEAAPSEPSEEYDADEKKTSLSKTAGLLSQVSPYTVMLAISVLAIGVALLCLILEWSSYGFNRKPPKNLSLHSVKHTVESHNSTA